MANVAQRLVFLEERVEVLELRDQSVRNIIYLFYMY